MDNIGWTHKPMCEACGDEIATSFSCSYEPHRWRFTGECTSKDEMYYVEFERFFHSPATIVDWMAHMQEKRWFDAVDFFKMMERLRGATRSYGAIQSC